MKANSSSYAPLPGPVPEQNGLIGRGGFGRRLAGRARPGWPRSFAPNSFLPDGDAGFLPQATDYKNWDEWTVTEPTFIVITISPRRAESVRQAVLLAIEGRRIASTHRCASLMLERPFDLSDPWVSELIPYGSPSGCFGLLRFRLSGPMEKAPSPGSFVLHAPPNPLSLTTTFARLSWASPARTAQDRVQTLDPASVVEWLGRVDPERRPLFLVLAARALRDGGESQLRRWNRA